MTGLVSTTFTMEEEDDGPGPPVRTWVDVDVAGGDWDESCPGCGGCPGAAATPVAPRPRLDPADPADPEEEEEGFPLEEEEEEDALLDFPGIAEGKSAKSPSSSDKRRSPGIRGRTGGGVPTAHRVSPGSLDGLLGGLGVTQGRDDPDIRRY